MLRLILKFGIVVVFLFGFLKSCPIVMQTGWKQMPIEDRARLSDIVAVGKAIEVRVFQLKFAREAMVVDFQLLDILKGRNITDKINADTAQPLFPIFGYGNPAQCMSSVNKGETYLLFAILERTTMSLVAAYHSPFGATADPSRENRDRVLSSLGWRPWSSWSSCSVSCSGGWQTRTRTCRSGDCKEQSSEKRRCNNYNCKGVKDLLKYFNRFRRKLRSIPPLPLHRNALRISNSGNFSVPTYYIFWGNFPQDFTMFASAKYVNYTEGYLLSFYDLWGRLQIGIKISKTFVALEYDESDKNPAKSVSFDVKVTDHKWHQFAFSVRNGQVSFYLDCNIIGTKLFKRSGKTPVDTNGTAYLNGQIAPPKGDNNNIEFYIEELSFSDDAMAGEEQCVAITDPYGHETSNDFSGSGDETVNEYEWASWTKCSQTCGKRGVRKRVKICKNLSINDPNGQCQAALQKIEEEPCNRFSCPAYCQQHCLNGGVCVRTNVCLCLQGYSGKSCEKAAPCKRTCLNGGQCIPSLGTCKCPKGFDGKFCEKERCHPSCHNGGTCVRAGVCRCRPGYGGPLCKPLCRPLCQNKGNCITPGRCQCRPGYSGYRCQRAVCTKPCLNGGYCYNRNKCICKSGWAGETCNIAICHPPCLNGGQCRAPNRCACPNETSGTYCQNVACYPRCLNGGKCVQGNKCVCSPKYTGFRCHTPVCIPNCQNGGKCVAPNQCVCPSGFYGDLCERSSTQENARRTNYHKVPEKMLTSFGLETVHGRKD